MAILSPRGGTTVLPVFDTPEAVRKGNVILMLYVLALFVYFIFQSILPEWIQFKVYESMTSVDAIFILVTLWLCYEMIMQRFNAYEGLPKWAKPYYKPFYKANWEADLLIVAAIIFTCGCVFTLVDDEKLNAYQKNYRDFEQEWVDFCNSDNTASTYAEQVERVSSQTESKKDIPGKLFLKTGYDFCQMLCVCASCVACLATNTLRKLCGNWMTPLTRVWQRPNFVKSLLFCSGLAFIFYLHQYIHTFEHIAKALQRNSPAVRQVERKLLFSYKRNGTPIDNEYELSSVCNTYKMNLESHEQDTLNSVFQVSLMIPDAENLLLRLQKQTGKQRMDWKSLTGTLIAFYFVVRTMSKNRAKLAVDLDAVQTAATTLPDSAMKLVLSSLQLEDELKFVLFMLTINEKENFDDDNIRHVSILCQTFFHVVMMKYSPQNFKQCLFRDNSSPKCRTPRKMPEIESKELRFVKDVSESGKQVIAENYNKSLKMIRHMTTQKYIIDKVLSGGSCNYVYPFFLGYIAIAWLFIKFEHSLMYTFLYISFGVYLEILNVAYLDTDLLTFFEEGVNVLKNRSRMYNYDECFQLLMKLFANVKTKGWKEALEEFGEEAETLAFHFCVSPPS